MKKMNKMYEAPVAEMIEMQMPVVLTGTMTGTGDPSTSGNIPGSGVSVPPIS